MFQKLKQHWKVNSINLALIIIVFALGGSLCGWAGRKLLVVTGLYTSSVWILYYVLMIILLWPIAVILVSIPFGQFNFFKLYIQKISNTLLGKQQPATSTRIAIFASGAGSNAQQIINHFAHSTSVKIALVVCNKPGAGVLSIAQKENIPSLLIGKDRFFTGDHYLNELQKQQINLIVLAGFLWKMPPELIKAYPGKIVNIHPALLPNYGGKGMYGHFVHEAVIANGEKESGISIHFVDELYDHGELIFQAKCPVDLNDTPTTLAQKIQALEHANYPAVIEKIITNG